MAHPAPTRPPEPEMIIVENDASSVSCDGGGGALGHPLVYYSFDGKDAVDCGYCDRRFMKARALSKQA